MKKQSPKYLNMSKLPIIRSEMSGDYDQLLTEISELLEQARHSAARSVNSILTATYWEIGRRIVEHEQGGRSRAGYGEELLTRLSKDLTAKYGRGFSSRNIRQMRTFYLGWEIWQTPSAKLEARAKCLTPSGDFHDKKRQTPSAESVGGLVPASVRDQDGLAPGDFFPLSWSQYVRLMAVANPRARAFYEKEAIRGGWSVRQLDRQISTQFYERALKAKKPEALLIDSQRPKPEDAISVDEEVRDPYLLEFLNLKDEYGESELEEALIRHLEWFLLEMGSGFPAKSGFVSAIRGIESTYCFIIEVFGVSWSLI